MSAFKYKILTGDGETKTGEVQAGGLEEAERRLQQQGATVISLVPLFEKKAKEAAGAKPLTQVRVGKAKAKPAELATVLRNLAVLAESGVPFYESLNAVQEGAESPALREGLEKVKSQVMAGRTLGQSLRSAPELFTPMVCDMVATGEESGRLDKALTGAAAYMDRAVALRAKLVNALIYPSILLGVAGLTVSALVFFIMPRFAETFKGMNIKPPAVTQALMDFGTTASTKPWLFIVVPLAVVFLIKFIAAKPVLRDFFLRLSRRIPVLGPVLRQLSLARMLSTLSSLLGSGVNLLPALESAGKVSGDPDIEAACEAAHQDVHGGGMLSESFKRTRVLPPTLVQMVAVGERSGRLSTLVERASEEMEVQADARLKSLMAIFEPIMILVMGGVIGLITFSLISPLFSVLQNVR
ncbi:MAG: type II secretion system F family protein [Fimbriimonadaceae bacterium]|nr:type II secretion system F family protein [Fimbriimonadaceae bacterium]